MSFGAQEAVWLCQLLHEINPVTIAMTSTPLYYKDIKITSTLPTSSSLTECTIVHYDNEIAIKLAKIQYFMQEGGTLVSNIILSGKR